MGSGRGGDLSAVLNASGQAGSAEPNGLGSYQASRPQFLPLPCESCLLCSVFLKDRKLFLFHRCLTTRLSERTPKESQ